MTNVALTNPTWFSVDGPFVLQTHTGHASFRLLDEPEEEEGT